MKAYTDRAEAHMILERSGAGSFGEVTLTPGFGMAAQEKALALHAEAHGRCFIARSVNFPVRHEPDVA